MPNPTRAVYVEGKCSYCGEHTVVHRLTRHCASLGCIDKRKAAGLPD